MSLFDANQGWNACVSKFVVNSGVGLIVGAAASLLFFKRRIPPMLYFTGLGGGWAIVDCNTQFKAMKTLQAKTVETQPKEPAEKYNIAPSIVPQPTEIQPVDSPAPVNHEVEPATDESEPQNS